MPIVGFGVFQIANQKTCERSVVAAIEVSYPSNHRCCADAWCSMRSPNRSRYYVQCPLTDKGEQWSDARFWDELRARISPAAAEAQITGPSIEKSIAPLRSFVAERFSWWLTILMRRFPDGGGIVHKLQTAELDYLVNSAAASTVVAENYVGLPR